MGRDPSVLKSKRFQWLAISVLLLLGLFAIANPISALASHSDTNPFAGTVVNPESQTCDVGSPCSVDLELEVAPIAGAYQNRGVIADLSFDPSVLEVTSITAAGPWTNPVSTWDNVNGTISYQTDAAGPIHAGGVFATITFNPKAGGVSALTWTGLQLHINGVFYSHGTHHPGSIEVDSPAAMSDSPWVGGGTGTLTVDSDGSSDSAQFTYAANPASTGNWYFQTTAASSGTYSIDWNYTGYHAWYQASAALESFVYDGSSYSSIVSLASSGTFGGFSFSGTESFTVQPGYIYGFRFSGSHNDSDTRLLGTLSIEELDNDYDGVNNNIDQCSATATGASVDADGCSSAQLDTDGDGVNNSLDQCSGSATGEPVDANGCELDDDGDGVYNGADDCSGSASGEPVNTNGCELDDDGDGVYNGADDCQGSASGEPVNTNGCELDTDGDGVYNGADDCPSTPSGAVVGTNGCQLDDDGDGVVNGSDDCAGSASGEPVGTNGCELDDDSDGVYNGADDCPGSASGEPVNTNGCELDEDGDGVYNGADNCSGSATGEPVDINGCESDDDSDGVYNGADDCPGSASGEAVGTNGCEFDDDSDGVYNGADNCSGSAAGEAVDANGCELDDDGDGVYNGADDCATTPSGAAVGTNGCQPDDDGDGVVNTADNCSGSASGEAVDANGCEFDDDSDGVYNGADDCSNTPVGEAANASGCSDSQADDDNDGVYNPSDECAGTPAGETANTVGCSPTQLDDDADGVNNALDQCPSTPLRTAAVDASGCTLDADGDGILDNVDVGDYKASDRQFAGGNVDLTFEKTGSTNSFQCFIAHSGPATADLFEVSYAGAVRACRGRIHRVSDETPNSTTSQLGSRGLRLYITKGDGDGDRADAVQVKCDSPLCMREWNGKLYPTTFSIADHYYIHDGPVSTKCICDYEMVFSANSSQVLVEQGETEVSIGEGDDIIVFTVAAGPDGAVGGLLLDNDEDGGLVAINEGEEGTPPITIAIDGIEVGVIEVGDSPLQVTSIDISSNNVNLKSKGKTKVAILSTDLFDATTEVDKSSLTFGRTGSEDSLHKCSEDKDANDDGLLDVVCHFNTQQAGFQSDSISGVLKGTTIGGAPIIGTNSVRIVPPSKPESSSSSSSKSQGKSKGKGK